MDKTSLLKAVAILLNVDTPEDRAQLNKVSVKTLQKIYNGYVDNAKRFQEAVEAKEAAEHKLKLQ